MHVVVNTYVLYSEKEDCRWSVMWSVDDGVHVVMGRKSVCTCTMSV